MHASCEPRIRRVRGVPLPACAQDGVSASEMDLLDRLSLARRRVKLGQTLYREGQRFEYLYAIRCGTLKSSLTLADGREQISGFHMVGDLLGLDGLAQGVYASTSMSREIVREHSLMMLLGSMDAEERLAAFLLKLSQSMKARGYSSTEFHLRMSRAEIGSYLGMKLETVSRTFSEFQRQGLLEVDKRHVRISDPEALQHAFEAKLQ